MTAPAIATPASTRLTRRSTMTGAGMSPAPTGSPPAAPTASPWATPGAQLQSFGAGNDLRGTSVLPADSARTQTASGQADTAFGAVANYTLPQWNSVGAYQSGNTMNGIAPLSTTPVAGPNYAGARGAMTGALPRASQLQGAAADALNGVGGVGFDGGAAEATWQEAQGAVGGPFDYAGDTTGLRSNLVQRLSTLQAPDRVRLATEAYDQIEEAGRPQFEQAMRSVGQKAAALGRIGSGVTTNEIGDLALARERDLNLQRRSLATEAAGAQLADQLDQAGAVSGGLGQLSGLDTSAEGLRQSRASLIKGIGDSRLSAAQAASSAQAQNASTQLQRASQLRGLGQDAWGMGMDQANAETGWADGTYNAATANENRRLDVGRDNTRLAQDQINFTENADRYGYQSGVTERDAGWRAAQDRGTFLTGQANTLGNREGQLRTVDSNARGELRDERGYQGSLADKAQADRIRMLQFGEQLQTGNYGNASSLFGTGQTGNVGGAYSDMAGLYGDQANGAYGAAGELASYLPYLQRRSQLPTGAASMMLSGDGRTA